MAETPSAPDCSHFIEGETGWRGEALSLAQGHWERVGGGTTPWLHIWAMGGGTWAVGRALGGHWRWQARWECVGSLDLILRQTAWGQHGVATCSAGQKGLTTEGSNNVSNFPG